METSGTTPPGALAAQDLADLAALADRTGPFATVVLGVSPDAVDAEHRLDVRWRNARRELEGRQVPHRVLDSIEAVVLSDPEDHRVGAALTVVATADGVCLVDHHDEPPRRDLLSWGPLPRLGHLVEWRQARVPHVVALVDRTGADVFALRGEEQEAHEEAGGREHPIRKVGPGGWSQRRFQQRAEANWEKNAADVADTVVRLSDDVGAKVIAIAGDVRAVELLQKALPDRVASLVHVVDGSRHPDGSEDEVAEGTLRATATVAAAESAQLLAKLREERGQDDRAVTGAAGTLLALAKGQVEVLLVHDDPDDERGAWFGPDPLQVGGAAEDVTAMGARSAEQGRLVDVAIRAALGSSAGIRVVPTSGQLDDGIGAILRWKD